MGDAATPERFIAENRLFNHSIAYESKVHILKVHKHTAIPRNYKGILPCFLGGLLRILLWAISSA